MKMSWFWYKGWLLFDENYLLLGCNYLSDYSPGMFLSKHLEALARWNVLEASFVCNFTVKYPLSACSKLLFVKTHHWLRLAPVLYCGGKCPIANITLCKCLCSSDAVHVQSSIFSSACTLIGGTLCCSDLGIHEFSNFYVLADFNSTFVKVGAIRRSVAVWYLQQGSECTVKQLLCVTVIAHRGTLSCHYIKPFDGVTLSGHY